MVKRREKLREDSDALAYRLGHGRVWNCSSEWEVWLNALILHLSLLESSIWWRISFQNTLEQFSPLSVWQVYLLGVERILALVMQMDSLLDFIKPSSKLDLLSSCLWSITCPIWFGSSLFHRLVGFQIHNSGRITSCGSFSYLYTFTKSIFIKTINERGLASFLIWIKKLIKCVEKSLKNGIMEWIL